MILPRSDRTWPATYAAIVVLVAAGFLFATRSILSPFLLYLLLLLLIWPFAGTRRHGILVIAATAVMAVWLLETLGSLLAPFLVAMGLAYILDPGVDLLERRGLPRTAAVAVLALPALLVIAAVALFGIPALAHQVEALVSRLPEVSSRLVGWLEGLRGRLTRLNLPFLSPDVVAFLDEERLGALLEERQAEIVQRAWEAVLGVGRQFGFVLTVLGYLVLTPVLIVYLLRDWDRITARVGELMPPSRRGHWTMLLREYDGLLSRFLRGQLLAALLVGVFTWLGLLIVGFPYSGLVGAVAGVFNVVPYLGLIVSLVPVVLIAALSGSFLVTLLKAVAVFVVVQLIDSSVTGPRIVGDSVGLHPVWVILAIAIGGSVFGFVGLLLAMPVAVGIKLLLRESIAKYRASKLYGAPAEPPA